MRKVNAVLLLMSLVFAAVFLADSDRVRAAGKDGVLNVGEEIDNACESCHLVYWYPDQKIPNASAASKS